MSSLLVLLARLETPSLTEKPSKKTMGFLKLVSDVGKQKSWEVRDSKEFILQAEFSW